jgi:hypothetical protein
MAPTMGSRASAARATLPSASLERVLFQEGLEVLAPGLNLLFCQSDDQQLGELETPGYLPGSGTSAWCPRRLAQASGQPPDGTNPPLSRWRVACSRRNPCTPPESHTAGPRTCPGKPSSRHPQRPLAGPPHLQYSRIPQRGLGDILHGGEDLLGRAPNNRHDLELVHLPSDLLCASSAITDHPATARPG